MVFLIYRFLINIGWEMFVSEEVSFNTENLLQV